MTVNRTVRTRNSWWYLGWCSSMRSKSCRQRAWYSTKVSVTVVGSVSSPTLRQKRRTALRWPAAHDGGGRESMAQPAIKMCNWKKSSKASDSEQKTACRPAATSAWKLGDGREGHGSFGNLTRVHARTASRHRAGPSAW